MLTPDQIEAIRDTLTQLTDPLTEYLLSDIARRVSEAGQLTSSAAYETWRLQNLGLSQAQIKKQLRIFLGKSSAEINALMTQTAKVGYDFDIKRLPTAGAVAFSENSVIQQTLSSAIKLAQSDFTNITQTLGMIDPYGRALPLQEVYRSCTDYAFKQVFTGAADYNTTIRTAVKNIADKGLLTIDYKTGIHTSLEAAVRRNIMGGLGLMQQEISQQNHDALGADGWEISAHAACAEDHEPIQGKQYTDAEYAALNASLLRPIGTLNCGHAAFPIIMGVNKPQYSQADLDKLKADNQDGVTYRGKQYTEYEATQQQRAIERAMRLQKRRVLLANGTGDAEQAMTAKTRLTLLRQEYKRFSKAVDLPVQNERVQLAGFGRAA